MDGSDDSLDERRFSRWLERLQKSIKDIDVSEECNADDLCSQVSTLIEKEESEFPRWVKDGNKITKYSSNAEEIRTHLRHIVLPHSIHSYQRLRQELLTDNNITHFSTTTASSAPTDSDVKQVQCLVPVPVQGPVQGPSMMTSLSAVTSSDSKSSARVRNFFDQVKSGDCQDGILGVCRLADVHHRLSRALVHDDLQVSQWATYEKSREENCGTSAAEKSEQFKSLTDGFCPLGPKDSEGRPLGSLVESMGKLQRETSSRAQKLLDAENAEDKAREAYQASIRVRESAAAGLNSAESLVAHLSQLKKVLLRVSAHRGEFDKYNAESAGGRLRLYEQLSTYLSLMKREISEGSVAREMPQMFGNLINSMYKSLDDLATANAIEPALQDGAVEIMPAIELEQEHKEEGAQQQVVEVSQDSINTEVSVVKEEGRHSGKTNADTPATSCTIDAIVPTDDSVPLSVMSDVTTISDVAVSTQSATDCSALALPLVPAKREVLGPTSFCAMRAGLETMRVWKQLCSHNLSPLVSFKMTALGDDLRLRLSKLNLPSRMDAESSGVFQRPDATVVLFYDHLTHNTPDLHVESIARVKSCLRLIAAQLHAQAVKGLDISASDPSSSFLSDGGQLPKRSTRRERRLHMLSCNDIIAPPLWVLPLVHSPQYLAHLWELAEEAKEGDLYVPLEFDTEWDIAENVPGDSDFDSDGSDREESSGRGRKKSSTHILKKDFTIEKGIKDLLGGDALKTLDRLFQHNKGDAAVATAMQEMDIIQKRGRDRDRDIFPPIKDPAVTRDRKVKYGDGRYVDGQDEEDSTPLENENDPESGPILSRGDRVRTPYGDGVVVRRRSAGEDEDDDSAGFVYEVKFEWGASGFLSWTIVQLLESRSKIHREKSSSSATIQNVPKVRRERNFEESGSVVKYIPPNVNSDIVRVKKTKHSISSDDIRTALKDAKEQGNLKSLKRADGRYNFTSPYLHDVIARISTVMGVGGQTHIANCIDTNVANMSLWVHGRTTKNLNWQIERNIKKWLATFDLEGILPTMVLTGAEDENPHEATGRGKYARKREEPSYECSAENAADEEKSSHPSRRHNFYNPVEASYAPRDKEGRMPQSWSRRTKSTDELRDFLKSVMYQTTTSQGALAKTFSRMRPREPELSQSVLSNWFYYKMKEELFNSVTACTFEWLDEQRSILSAEEVAQLEALHLAVDSPSSGQGQTDRGAKGQGRKSLAAQQAAKELKDEKEKGIEEGKVEEGEGGEGGEEDENNEVEEEAEGEGSDGDIMSIEDEAEMSERDKKEEEGEVEEGSESLDVKEMDMEGEAEVGAGVAETRVDAATEQQSVQEGTQDNTGENTQNNSLDNSSANRDSQETESIVWSSLEEARAVEEVVPFVPPTEPVKDPTTVGQLHLALLEELKRRNIPLSLATREAGIVQPALTKFVSKAVIPNNERGQKLSVTLLRWLRHSRKQAPTPTVRPVIVVPPKIEPKTIAVKKPIGVKENEGGTDRQYAGEDCPLCGANSRSFTTSQGFKMHVRWCERRKAKADGVYKTSPRASVGVPASSDDEGDGEGDVEEEDYEEGEGEEGNYGAGDAEEDGGDEGEEEEDDDDVEEEEGDEESEDGAVPYSTAASSSSTAPEGVFTHALLNPTGRSVDGTGNTTQPTAQPYVSSRKSALLTGIRTETLRLCAADTIPTGLRYRTCERCKDVKDSAMKMLAKKGGLASPVKAVATVVVVPTLGVVGNGEAKATEAGTEKEKENAMDVEKGSSVLENENEDRVRSDVTSVAVDVGTEPLHTTDTHDSTSISISGNVKQEDVGVIAMDVETPNKLESIEIETEITTNLGPSSGPGSTPGSDPRSIITLSCVRCPCVYHWDCAVALGPTDGAAVGEANQFICHKCRESGASTATVLTAEEKSDPTWIIEKWVLLWANQLRRWRLGLVIARLEEGHIVIKWWRSDNKCGKKDMFVISDAEVLHVSPPEGATELMMKSERTPKIYRAYDGSVLKTDEADDASDGWFTKTGRKRKQKKIVEEKRPYKRHRAPDGSVLPVNPESGPGSEVTRVPKGRPSLVDSRFKSRKLGRPRSMPMDGHNDSSLPPRSVLSASGIGGASGLRWADDESFRTSSGRGRGGGRGSRGGRMGLGSRGGRGGRGVGGRGGGRGSRVGRGSQPRRSRGDVGESVEDGEQSTPEAAGMSDTYVSAQSLQAALCAAGTSCRAVDIAMCSDNTNAFACTRPPGHHAGRYGCTGGCLSTGFCLLNNAAIAMVYARVRWGLERVAVVDIDVHFGNGTAELLKDDPGAFFASVHMIYGDDNDGNEEPKAATSSNKMGRDRDDEGNNGFYPSMLGTTEVTDNYVSVGVFPPHTTPPPKGERIYFGRYPAATVKAREMKVEKRESGDGEEKDVAVEDVATDADRVEGTSSDALEIEDEDENILTAQAAPSALAEVNDMDVEAQEEGEGEMGDDVREGENGHAATGSNGEQSTHSTPPKSPLHPSVPHSATPTDHAGAVTDSGLKATDLSRGEFRGVAGFRRGLSDVIIPQMEKFKPQLLIISAGFDGYHSDPIGGELGLSTEDYVWCTKQLMAAMDRVSGGSGQGRVVSLLEGGYDTQPQTLGLAVCVDAHVKALRNGGL